MPPTRHEPAPTRTVPLRASTLDALPAEVLRPRYDRSRVRTGIVHLGLGNFHRAHQAMYLDALMEQGLAMEWGICGVGLMPRDAAMRDALRRTDGLYTLVLKHPDGTLEPRVVGSVVDYLYAPDDPQRVVDRLADPAVRIVSLTVTEGGYNLDPATGEFDLGAAAVRADLSGTQPPATIFGLVSAALDLRRQRGIQPFTVMSCDNIPHNGDVARRAFGAFARAVDPALGDWVLEHVAFPSCMVDRITPVTTDDDRAEVLHRWGVEDPWPVVAEPFTQWVLEDHFPLGRPELDRVGVQLVADVTPYELMKLRLLNASHQALCYFGYLAGYRLVHEACQDPLFADFLLAYMSEEATPTLPPVPGVDLPAYRATLVERFSNPHVKDTVARLCAESSDRIPTWLVPVIRENLAAGGPVELSAAVVASWARYAEGTDEQGEPIIVVDQLAEQLVPLARAQVHGDDPDVFVRDERLFGDLASSERFLAAYRRTLASLHQRGARATLESLVEGTSRRTHRR
ncbi:mannitol dehydrogenase family protein [Auraticoccus sp. F435]|uniref:Mannitol-1-phosphate 5-dehydrogenase n=1 Tax=Auraticoccus cholistanensis TaxID=2656650 RepID=A0A6A9UTH1_9ACTN|nr:mannitol dehydrogenase family protein [Auraticoccus cholistanensis]MVA75035.1 mannitol dehydrogenase family protein [Auraticoccus cholistanensis]